RFVVESIHPAHYALAHTRGTPMATRLLFLAANPSESSQLSLDKEAREVSISLRRARSANRFRVEQRWAARHEDLRRAMLVIDPASPAGAIQHKPERKKPAAGRSASPGTLPSEQRVVMFTHDAGLTTSDALALQRDLVVSGVRCVVAQHRNRSAPDAAFIS